MLLGLFFYFLLSVLGVGLVVLPGVRERVGAGAASRWTRFRGVGRSRRAAWSTALHRPAASAVRTTRFAASAFVRRRRSLALAAAALVGAPLAAWTWRSAVRINSFDPDAVRAIDARVAALLKGEALVPPSPLPPDLFATPEVERWQPLARSASRKWDLLDPGFRQRLLLAFELVHRLHGYELVLIEGYRSPERQAALAALGPSVTRAGPFESWHQHGLAADCAFLRDGRIVISEKDAWAMTGYQRFGEVARSLGLVWGGDWQRLRDYGHVEWPRPRLRAG